MEISLRDVYQEIRELRNDIVNFKEKSIQNEMMLNAVHVRLDACEEDLKKIKEQLEGNVTIKTLHRWLIGLAGVLAALGVVFGAVFKLFGG
ncbi:MAG: hypothetical protein NC548_32250 [Lachnospiraceae bacterium]|nr:hypothetical protein [Lachnospiraceae bacterium]